MKKKNIIPTMSDDNFTCRHRVLTVFFFFQYEETPRDEHLVIYRDNQTQTMRGWYRDDADTVPYSRKKKQKQAVFFTN